MTQCINHEKVRHLHTVRRTEEPNFYIPISLEHMQSSSPIKGKVDSIVFVSADTDLIKVTMSVYISFQTNSVANMLVPKHILKGRSSI